MRLSGMTCTPSITRSHYLRLGYRDDELPALRAVLLLLAQHLRREIPHEKQEVVGPAVEHRFGREDGEVGARRVEALLHRRSVDDEVKRLPTDAHVVEQRRALGGCSVSGQLLVRALEVVEHRAQLLATSLDALAEPGAELHPAHPAGAFLVQPDAHRR